MWEGEALQGKEWEGTVPQLQPSLHQPLGSTHTHAPHTSPAPAEAEELYQKRVLTITGICVALLVVGIVCVVAYCKTK